VLGCEWVEAISLPAMACHGWTFTLIFTGHLGASINGIILAMIVACLLLMLAKYKPLELPDIFAL
jgi:hypothetical protein